MKHNSTRAWLRLAIIFVLPVAFVSMTIGHVYKPAKNLMVAQVEYPGTKKTDAQKKTEEESKAAFRQAYTVFMSARCMNCHPSGDVPLQGDDSHLHLQGVKRGIDGKGLYALKCSNCHQEQHVPGESTPPGAKGWHLPPMDRKMVFQGKTPTELANNFKNNKFTGFKDFKKDMLHHVETEPLVLVGWTYGTPPPLSHQEFVSKVKEWIDKGAVTP